MTKSWRWVWNQLYSCRKDQLWSWFFSSRNNVYLKQDIYSIIVNHPICIKIFRYKTSYFKRFKKTNDRFFVVEYEVHCVYIAWKTTVLMQMLTLFLQFISWKLFIMRLKFCPQNRWPHFEMRECCSKSSKSKMSLRRTDYGCVCERLLLSLVWWSKCVMFWDRCHIWKLRGHLPYQITPCSRWRMYRTFF